MAVAGVALLCWGAMRAPYLYGSAVVHEVAQAWARLDNYRAAVQCISRVPGFQMEWTGQQYYRKPGHLRTDLEIAGGPVRLVTDGDLAAYDGPVSGPSPSICRFILRTVQLEALVSVLPALEGVKYEGSGEILGEKCQVISFPESASEASPAREGPPPGSASPGRGRAWISDRIHLPLQVEYYMSDGALAVSYRCVRLLPNVGVDDPGISLPPGSASARSFGRIVVVTEQRKFSVAE
jgi:outer membrane lipoprotein-sorting protein